MQTQHHYLLYSQVCSNNPPGVASGEVIVLCGQTNSLDVYRPYTTWPQRRTHGEYCYTLI